MRHHRECWFARPRPRNSRTGSAAEVAEHADVLVVGGGQAGLAASYYLSQAGIPHVVLDAERRVGDAWR
jgi:cation diffusion facilitator CzcD-associated flavoprotein CzcO